MRPVWLQASAHFHYWEWHELWSNLITTAMSAAELNHKLPQPFIRPTHPHSGLGVLRKRGLKVYYIWFSFSSELAQSAKLSPQSQVKLLRHEASEAKFVQPEYQGEVRRAGHLKYSTMAVWGPKHPDAFSTAGFDKLIGCFSAQKNTKSERDFTRRKFLRCIRKTSYVIKGSITFLNQERNQFSSLTQKYLITEKWRQKKDFKRLSI